MDHSLKLWNLSEPEVVQAIEASYTHEPSRAGRTAEVHFPEFSTRDIHRNYVDCVRWFGKFVLSKVGAGDGLRVPRAVKYAVAVQLMIRWVESNAKGVLLE